MMWSAYNVGSSGYIEASDIVDVLMREHNVRIRLMPSGTSVGCPLSLRAQRLASFGVGVAGDAGVTDLKELRSNHVARVQASTSVKVEAIIELADRIRDDVEVMIADPDTRQQALHSHPCQRLTRPLAAHRPSAQDQGALWRHHARGQAVGRARISPAVSASAAPEV